MKSKTAPQKCEPLNTLIVGLGGIGAKYDYDMPEKIFTHAKAIEVHSSFTIVAGIDPDESVREKFTARYCKPAYTSLSDLTEERVDVVVLCSPTETHKNVLKAVLDLSPRAIVCEKPIASTVSDAEEIITLCHSHSIILLINYWRRLEKAVSKIKEDLCEGMLGRLCSGVVWYQRGMLNNGSHFVDLLLFLFGKPDSFGLNTPARTPENDNYDFFLCYGGAKVHFVDVGEAQFNYFEMSLVCEKGVIEYKSSGRNVTVRNVSANDLFPGFNSLAETPIKYESSFDQYQMDVYNHLNDVVYSGGKVLSSGETAIESMRILESIADEIALRKSRK